MRTCTGCGLKLVNRWQKKFCSNKCQNEYKWKVFIKLWKNGKAEGGIGITAKNVSGHVKRYLIQKYGSKCSQCGWHKKHPVTGVVPLEIDHIDGNSENNIEENLRLLCPNCHALTPFYKNLNRGKGRKWRMEKYIKNPVQ